MSFLLQLNYLMGVVCSVNNRGDGVVGSVNNRGDGVVGSVNRGDGVGQLMVVVGSSGWLLTRSKCM